MTSALTLTMPYLTLERTRPYVDITGYLITWRCGKKKLYGNLGSKNIFSPSLLLKRVIR